MTMEEAGNRRQVIAHRNTITRAQLRLAHSGLEAAIESLLEQYALAGDESKRAEIVGKLDVLLDGPKAPSPLAQAEANVRILKYAEGLFESYWAPRDDEDSPFNGLARVVAYGAWLAMFVQFACVINEIKPWVEYDEDGNPAGLKMPLLGKDAAALREALREIR